MSAPGQLPPPSRKRRIIAAALSPLAGAALLMPLVWEESTHMMSDHGARAAFFASARVGLTMSYAMATTAIPVAWVMMIWTKAHHRMKDIVPSFVVGFGLGGLIVGQSVAGSIGGALFGLPVAYGLLVGAPWRMRRIEREPFGPS